MNHTGRIRVFHPLETCAAGRTHKKDCLAMRQPLSFCVLAWHTKKNTRRLVPDALSSFFDRLQYNIKRAGAKAKPGRHWPTISRNGDDNFGPSFTWYNPSGAIIFLFILLSCSCATRDWCGCASSRRAIQDCGCGPAGYRRTCGRFRCWGSALWSRQAPPKRIGRCRQSR